MTALKFRRAIVYLTTGIFFVVAAVAQLQGNTALDAFTKAGVAAAVLTCGGMALAHIVDDAVKKGAAPAPKAATETKTAEQPSTAVAAATPTALAEGMGNS